MGRYHAARKPPVVTHIDDGAGIAAEYVPRNQEDEMNNGQSKRLFLKSLGVRDGGTEERS
jgi:hypothetical protein